MRAILAGLSLLCPLLGAACTALPQATPAPLPQATPAPLPQSALERLDLYGDLRLRYESTFERQGTPDRDRQRMRGRLGANYQIDEEVRVGARLVTGDADDPNSPYVTLGDSFDGFEVSLDRLFLDYRPASSAGTRVTAGKFDHGFERNPIYGELVWDADVQPEGALVRQSLPGALGLDSVDLAFGAYVVEEQSLADDASLWVSQVAGSRQLGAQRSAHLALAYYYYPDPTPDGSTTLVERSDGNALEGDGFASDFGVLDVNASLRGAGDRPWALSGEYLHNVRADDRERGWATGVSYGDAAKKGEWRAYYQWQVLEQDAVFSAFAQDDFVFRTNHRSHVAGYQRKVTDDMEIHLWGLVSESNHALSDGSNEDGVWRLRLDLNVKF